MFELVSVLDKRAIEDRLGRRIGDKQRLDISPLGTAALQSASIDLQLGHWFTITRRTQLPSLRPGSYNASLALHEIAQEEIWIGRDSAFLLHPGDFVLGISREFVALPDDVMAFVEGRSSIGRMGLVVATASQVAPGFHGVITLEFANAGTVPLELCPGLAVAQLVLLRVGDQSGKTSPYSGKYYCQVRAHVAWDEVEGEEIGISLQMGRR